MAWNSRTRSPQLAPNVELNTSSINVACVEHLVHHFGGFYKNGNGNGIRSVRIWPAKREQR